MKTDFMSSDPHERARLMIALSGPGDLYSAGLSHAEQLSLAEHLESCPPCREFAAHSREAIRALRAIPITAGESLVSTTRLRVRERAEELQAEQARLWMISICCVAVTLCTLVSTAVLWMGLAWIGRQARLSPPVWESGLVVFWLMPTVMSGILLLARGTYLAEPKAPFQG